MTMKNLTARRRGHVKILICDTMLPQLTDAVVHDDAVAVTLVCHDWEWHVVDRARQWAYKHCLFGVFTGRVADVAIELDACTVCAVVVQRLIEQRLGVFTAAQHTQLIR